MFEGAIFFNKVVTLCWAIVIGRIEYMGVETQPTGNSIMVISCVDKILILYAPRTLNHLSGVLLDVYYICVRKICELDCVLFVELCRFVDMRHKILYEVVEE